ncbi:hypothetical protein CJ030_MR6G022946 [Morella rubra]|uniref:Uncharacterized protein n=1 Tax=Morella rubra TaxID=262757 RepID=A0A6A1VAS7_9ROSI|nr:hypothetical protein CJ030_MR6G022946 [Morella rubra]
MMQEEWLAKQWAEFLIRPVTVEHEVYVVDFEELRYQGASIGNVLDDQGWISYLKREGMAFIDLVREFYLALLDIVDIDAQVWSITLRRVTFLLSTDILARLLGMQRQIGAFPVVVMENKPSAEDVFRTLTGQEVVVIASDRCLQH